MKLQLNSQMRTKALEPANATRQRGVIVFGAGGHARELSDQLNDDGIRQYAFVDDFSNGHNLLSYPVLPFMEAMQSHPDAAWLIAIGDPHAREAVAKRLDASGLVLGTFVSSKAVLSPSAVLQAGVQVFSGSVVSSGAKLGRCVIINFGCVVSHDVELADYVTVSPGSKIAGHAEIGARCMLGVGACILNGRPAKRLKIGEDCIVGAGACVVADVQPGLTVIGIPARPMRMNPNSFSESEENQ